MNPCHRPIEERKEPYNSKLLLISSITSIATTLLEKQNQFCGKLMNKIISVKKKTKRWASLFYPSKLVTFCSYYHCFSKYYSKREESRIKLMTAWLF